MADLRTSRRVRDEFLLKRLRSNESMVLYQWKEGAERFEMWWAHRTPSQAHTPTSNFPKCPLRSLLAKTNLSV